MNAMDCDHVVVLDNLSTHVHVLVCDCNILNYSMLFIMSFVTVLFVILQTTGKFKCDF